MKTKTDIQDPATPVTGNSFDYPKALQNAAQQYEANKGACPNCGHCPHCGRGGYRTYPNYPYYGGPQYVPYWITNTVPMSYNGGFVANYN
jgi:hypothetical protein